MGLFVLAGSSLSWIPEGILAELTELDKFLFQLGILLRDDTVRHRYTGHRLEMRQQHDDIGHLSERVVLQQRLEVLFENGPRRVC